LQAGNTLEQFDKPRTKPPIEMLTPSARIHYQWPSNLRRVHRETNQMNSTLKSALLGSASFALMLAAAGSNSAQAQTGFDGFYAGIQGGYHSFSASTSEAAEGSMNPLFAEGIPLTGFFEGGNKRSLSGFTGGVFGGYGRSFGAFYIGGEVEVGYSGASNKQSSSFQLIEGCTGGLGGNATLNTKIRAKESYGGSLRLGYIITPGAMLYTRFGVQRTKFKVESTMSFEGFGALGEGAVSVINQSKTFTGFRFGVGAELLLGQMFPTSGLGGAFVRIDWSHTWYGKKTFTGEGFGTTTNGSSELFAAHSIEVKPTENRFMFGIGVRF
jgi:hypothetical protein